MMRLHLASNPGRDYYAKGRRPFSMGCDPCDESVNDGSTNTSDFKLFQAHKTCG